MAETLLKYYVYDRTVKEQLAGVNVRSDDHGRYVRMTLKQAQYWLDQGTIGLKPISALSSTRQGTLNQLSGGKLDGYAASAAEIVAGGADYAADDTITLSDGVVLTVTAVDGSGAVTGVTITDDGFTRTLPTNPVAETATSGGGDGLATFNLTWIPATE